MSVKLKVFSFNLRHETEVDGINNFWNRTGRVLDAIESHKPDLIGFQEVTGMMRAWLKASLRDYTVYAPSCFDGDSPVIAFRSEVFDLLAVDHAWLSLTPSVRASRYGLDQSKYPRMVISVKLKHRDSDTPLRFFNTHLDHKGAIARLLAAVQIMQAISREDGPFVLTGDFNAAPDTPEIRTILTCPHLPVTDATAALTGTFHSYGKKEIPTKIDYVFTNAACTPEESFIIEDKPEDGLYITDHNVVVSYITLE